MVGFQQATIKVEKEKEFAELKGAITRVFAPQLVERFLKQVRSAGLRIRDFDAVLAAGAIDRVDEVLARSGTTTAQRYQALTVSDQAQIREFYLFQVEGVDPRLRGRFQKLYQYY